MKVVMRELSGATVEIEYSKVDTGKDLKKRFAIKKGYYWEQIALYCAAGQQIMDSETLDKYGIEEGSFVYALVNQLEGSCVHALVNQLESNEAFRIKVQYLINGDITLDLPKGDQTSIKEIKQMLYEKKVNENDAIANNVS